MGAQSTPRYLLLPRFALLAAVLFLLLPLDALAVDEQKRLVFFHTHTGKSLDVVFAVGDEPIPAALNQINDFLADFRNGEVIEIDPELLHLLYDIQQSLGSSGRYEVISAFRSPQTNEMLREQGRGVARKSQHILGTAIDVRLSDVELRDLRDAALAQQRGGVGYYPRSNFVHIDTGRVRQW